MLALALAVRRRRATGGADGAIRQRASTSLPFATICDDLRELARRRTVHRRDTEETS